MESRKLISNLLFVSLLMFCSCSSQQAVAQTDKKATEKKSSKLGSMIRKVGEAATGINMSNETFVSMNFDAQKLIAMEVISCVGDSKTGQVQLTLAVKAKQEGVKTNLGKSCGNGNQECVMAYDTKGNSFEGRELGTYTEVAAQRENPMNIPVHYSFGFTNIPASLTDIEMVRVEFYIAAKSGNVGSNMSNVEPIQVRNIPILWDVEEE